MEIGIKFNILVERDLFRGPAASREHALVTRVMTSSGYSRGYRLSVLRKQLWAQAIPSLIPERYLRL